MLTGMELYCRKVGVNPPEEVVKPCTFSSCITLDNMMLCPQLRTSSDALMGFLSDELIIDFTKTIGIEDIINLIKYASLGAKVNLNMVKLMLLYIKCVEQVEENIE